MRSSKDKWIYLEQIANEFFYLKNQFSSISFPNIIKQGYNNKKIGFIRNITATQFTNSIFNNKP